MNKKNEIIMNYFLGQFKKLKFYTYLNIKYK
jgi:hypothetical protein